MNALKMSYVILINVEKFVCLKQGDMMKMSESMLNWDTYKLFSISFIYLSLLFFFFFTKSPLSFLLLVFF